MDLDMSPAKAVITLQIMGMLSHGPDFRPEIPENLDSLPGGTFDGIHHYIQLMRDCWAEVHFSTQGLAIILVHLQGNTTLL